MNGGNSMCIRRFTLAPLAWACLATISFAAEKGSDTDLILSGRGWSLTRLADGERAFANRSYVWQGVPEKFRDWRVTQVSGGVRAELHVKARHDTTLFAATAGPSGIDLAGWNPVAQAAFHYSDKGKTAMTVYCRLLKAGDEIAVPQGNWTGTVVLVPPDGAAFDVLATPAPTLERLKYNNPGLVVDLGVGLWAWPLPMDFDGDGDLDLVVNCPDKPYNGVYFFENAGGDTAKNKMPVFKPGRRISKGLQNVQVSYVDGTAARALAGHRVSRLPQDRPGEWREAAAAGERSSRTRSAATCGATSTTTATARST